MSAWVNAPGGVEPPQHWTPPVGAAAHARRRQSLRRHAPATTRRPPSPATPWRRQPRTECARCNANARRSVRTQSAAQHLLPRSAAPRGAQATSCKGALLGGCGRVASPQRRARRGAAQGAAGSRRAHEQRRQHQAARERRLTASPLHRHRCDVHDGRGAGARSARPLKPCEELRAERRGGSARRRVHRAGLGGESDCDAPAAWCCTAVVGVRGGRSEHPAHACGAGLSQRADVAQLQPSNDAPLKQPTR